MERPDFLVPCISRPLFLLTAAALVVGCQPGEPLGSSDESRISGLAIASSRGVPQRQFTNLDDKFAEVARAFPGFGGMYYDTDGVLTVMLTDPTRLAAARPHVERFIRAETRRRVGSLPDAPLDIGPVRARRATYDFRLLLAWRRTHVVRAVSRTSDVTMTAIDHRRNKIVVGVTSADRMAAVERLMAELPIPASAIELIQFGEIVETASIVNTTLRSVIRPAPGGVQISRQSGSQTKQCTLGFNVVRWLSWTTRDTTEYFLTASHCSAARGIVDNSYFGQPGINDHGGTEIVDPPYVTYPTAGCPPSRICYLADASLYKYPVASHSDPGYLARTAVNDIYVSGRISVDGIGEPTQGYTVNMIGRSSGRTVGTVQFPCADVSYPSPSLDTVLCVAIATYSNQTGDSGGPVVELHGDGTTGYALGLNFARVNTSAYGMMSLFSPMSNILNLMYNVSGFYLDPTTSSSAPPSPPPPSPPSYYAIISGTSTAGPNMTCHWYSGSNIADASVEWIVNGNVVGTNEDLYYSSPTSFVLQVHYWNSDIGAHAWDSVEIAVHENAAQCYDQ